jgi:hypothetical protein
MPVLGALSNDIVRVHLLTVIDVAYYHSQSELGDAGQSLIKHTCSTLVHNTITASMG